MKNFIFLALCQFAIQTGNSQTVSEVIKKGVPLKKNQAIFLTHTGNVFKFTLTSDFARPSVNPNQYHDSTLFLPRSTGVNVYLQPLNPLSFSYDTAVAYLPDQINEEADKAFGSIISFLGKYLNGGNSGLNSGVNPSVDNQIAKTAKDTCICKQCEKLWRFPELLKTLKNKFDADPKDKIIAEFRKLKGLPFDNQKETKYEIDADSIEILAFQKHYDSIRSDIANLRSQVESFDCEREDAWLIKGELADILNDVQNTFNAKLARLGNLKKAHELVLAAYKRGQEQTAIGSPWFNKEPIYVEVDEKKLTYLTIVVNASGFEVKSDDGEIIGIDKKVISKKVLRFRRFQLFIPEVSAGVALTNLTFPKYGTSKNLTTGIDTVANAGEESFKNVNFSAMINWVLYTGADVSPFIQTGIGVKADYPTFFVGGGARFSLYDKVLSVSGGFASTWIKQLSTLHIGSPVSGTAELEKDLKYEFKWPLKFYVGIQYHF